MTKFLDGPATGKTLMLRRTPKLLRVVQAGDEFDALNEINDTARPGESLFCYVMHQYHGTCHIYRGRHGSGFYPMAEYRLRPDQPTDEQMRDNEAWSRWCDGTPEAMDFQSDNEINRGS